MKKNLLLMMMCCPAMLTAQNGVTVSGLAISAGTVTFNVSWQTPMPVELWSDTVWVFVDYNKNGVMERLPVTGGTATAGTVTKISNNDKGVWVTGNARTQGSFSATVQLFTATTNVGGACVYGSNYPPVGEYKNNVTEISFTGTPEYKVVLERNDISTYTTTVSKDESLSIPSSEVVLSFTDKTGAPGIILGGIFQQQGSCTYIEPAVVGTFAGFDPGSVGAATYVSLTDERDNKNYPVLKMGDRWIMARNLNYQTGLTWQANSADPATGVGSNTALIGNFWCPGTSGAMTSTQASCEVYGALYSWETAMMLDGTGTWTEDIKTNTVASAGTYNHGRTAHNGAGAGGRGICPPNWHVPTDAEWGLFFDAVENDGKDTHSNASGNIWVGVNAGQKSKAACTGTATDSAPLWAMTDGDAGEDTLGFRLLPTGARAVDGEGFISRGSAAWFWSSSAADESWRWHRVFDVNAGYLGHWACRSMYGLSIRCIRD